jgi:hypothetical protein
MDSGENSCVRFLLGPGTPQIGLNQIGCKFISELPSFPRTAHIPAKYWCSVMISPVAMATLGHAGGSRGEQAIPRSGMWRTRWRCVHHRQRWSADVLSRHHIHSPPHAIYAIPRFQPSAVHGKHTQVLQRMC